MTSELAIMILKKNREDILNTLAPETSLKGSIETVDYTVALTKAINSLERDMEKPLEDAMLSGIYSNYVSGYCPNCGSVIAEQLSTVYRYCRKCGQKIKMEGGE